MSVDTNLKILVVEDSGITRKMEIKALNQLGFNRVVEAEDGVQASKMLAEQADVDLIISDWNMPNMDGYELLCQVRSNELTREVPFIMATARGEKKQAEKAISAGVSSFISKPFSPPELKEVIESVLQSPGAAVVEKSGIRVPEMTDSGKLRLNIGHIQITDHLTLGVLQHLIRSEKLAPRHFELATHCMPSWNPVQRALEKGELDGAFVLAPIAMDLFSYGVPLKLVLFAHKNGSIAVQKKRGKSDGETDLKSRFEGKTFYIPHELSIHHMLSHMFLKEIGLKPGAVGRGEFDVFFEVVPPVRMPEFLKTNPEAGGYMVAEPLGTKAIAEGIADQLFLSGQMWTNHPCCVVALREEVLKEHEGAVQEFVEMLVESGRFIQQKPEAAAEIGVAFLDPEKTLGLKVPVLKNVLKEAQGIKTHDLFPVVDDLKRIADYMGEEMGIGAPLDFGDFVETRFAEAACGGIMERSAFRQVGDIISELSDRGTGDRTEKSMLGIEGNYLIFSMADQEYGVGILSVREIIGMMSITSIPRAPSYVKGVINLRGRVIPVVDLRLKFGLEPVEYDARTSIVVLDIRGPKSMFQVGMIVDAVSDVSNIRAEDTEESPRFGLGGNTSYILSMAKMEGGVKVLLDVDVLFGGMESLGVSGA